MDARPAQFQNIYKGSQREQICVPSGNSANQTVSREAGTARSEINRICNSQAFFFDHMMRREKPDHRVATKMIEGKRCRGKRQGKMLDVLTKLLNLGQVTDALKVTRDRGGWKFMIAFAKEQSIWLIDLMFNQNI